MTDFLPSPARSPDLRSDLAKARDKYFLSERGRKARDASTLGAPPSAIQYLTNRLEAAFIAGWEAAKADNEQRR